MNPITATVDTQISSYSSIGTINVLDDVTIGLTILTNGIINAPWVEPEFQLIGVKADKNEVRQLDGFNVTSLENRTLAIKLKNEMLTYPGMLKLQLITKDSGRTSTTVFYLYVGQSLEHDIVSHRDVKVLDDLEAYVEKANHNLEIYEQRMDIRDEQFNNLNDLMNQAEAKRDQAELTRQQIFDVNEASRTRTFNNQMNNQETSFNDVQIERANEFERDQTKRADDFVQAQNNREQAFNESQSANQSTFNSNEKKRQDEFNANQTSNQKIFNDSESARARIFEVAESERCENEKTRKEDESKRVSDEVKRVEAENKRQQKMQEFEDIANQIASDLQEQVARVDEFVTANELKLLEEDARIDYMGNQQKSIRKVNEANVDYAVKTAIGEFNYLDYEGQHITATNSIEGHARSAILKGCTLVNHYKIRGQEIDNEKIWANNTVSSLYSKGIYFIKNNTPHRMTIGVYQIEPILYADIIVLEGGGYRKVELGDNRFFYQFLGNFNDGWTSEDDLSRAVTILQYQEGMENWDIPYFEGMQSVRMPVLRTTGKNLFDGELELGAIMNTDGEYIENDSKVRNKNKFIDVLPNEVYSLNSTTITRHVAFYDKDKKFINSIFQTSANYFTTPTNCYFVNFSFSTNDLTLKIQLERGTTITPFEEYKSNILSTPSELELRGIDDVKDELNLLNGKLTQRIGEVIFDGSEDWQTHDTTTTNTVRYYLGGAVQNAKPFSEDNGVCDKIPYARTIYDLDEIGILLTTVNGHCYLRSTIRDLSEFKTWLQSNPITVQYRLATESVKTVDLSDNVVYSYGSTTHYSCSSEEGSLVPTLSVKVPTDVQATIAQQRNTIQALESENEALKDGLIEANQYREDGDMDLLSNQWDIDFRLFEIEMALDVPMAVAYKIAKENDSMSRFLQAKTLILGGRYERSKMEYQLKRYLEAGQLTQEEYDELISLMDAREMLE
ncbi:hypothetical protein GMB34_13610 [Turicibacter sanguinis]|nr:hypothetical protein [Turicibacter sanguinis]MTN85254.1 hypothetical protein [Turicibacter sanguinis]MTN88075.1 hypothetical protein [Turicibacter sanguinis]MTN90929.1 hypothetical protein [Turicibacter sanguinis]MTN93758.1 hypothetical protein [Turicibacter sanguinis]